MKERIAALLQEIKPDVDFATATGLIENGLLASLDIIQTVGMLNDEFDITIPFSEVVPQNFNSVDSIAALVAKLQDDD